MKRMDQRIVKKLEQEIEAAIDEVFAGNELKRLPLVPSHHTIHLMSKAAVTVYETAVENQLSDESVSRP